MSKILSGFQEIVSISSTQTQTHFQWSHPNSWVCKTGNESLVTEGISQMFSPPGSTCPKSIQCLMNDQNMPFKPSKLMASNNIQLFLSQSLQISIFNVQIPDLPVVQLSQKTE